MADYDPTDFVDNDFQTHKTPHTTVTASGGGHRAPTREEVDTRVVEAQQKLAELKRAQEELERERAGLEETRRRRRELETGRQELVHSLTRGLGLLEEAEFAVRRDAEQMGKTLEDLRDALHKVEAIHEESWTKDNFEVELTRALTALENARMEWNSARLKFTVLSSQTAENAETPAAADASEHPLLSGNHSFFGLCRIGLALTWPLTVAIFISLGILLAARYYWR
jgi:chromosome segregation ATPase